MAIEEFGCAGTIAVFMRNKIQERLDLGRFEYLT